MTTSTPDSGQAKIKAWIVETVGPISSCKDYLNDQVYSEATGNNFGAYGYWAKKKGIFTDGFGYVVFGIMPEKHSPHSLNSYASQVKETAYLSGNFLNVAKFVNAFEAELKLPLTEIHELEHNRYLAIIPDFWCRYTYLISLWTLLVRVAIESYYDGAEFKPTEFLEKCRTGDSMAASGPALTKYKQMVSGVIPVQDFAVECFWHDCGISGFYFPE